MNTKQIHTTTDYHLFRPIDGNRNKNLKHINKLKESMRENYLFTVITVNEKYEIIDGQHRFDVIKELKLPLHYIICENYSLQEVHILNQISKTWNMEDYLQGYCDLGYSEYLAYKAFKEKYKIGHNECIYLVSSQYVTGLKNIFNSGLLQCSKLVHATNVMEKIIQIEPYYTNTRRRAFIFALSKLLKNSRFNFDDFLYKLKAQPKALVDCTSVDSYVELIEEIYNYRRREKINLRFS